VQSRGDPLKRVIGLAWDCGAVTTGPVTVPCVIALGVGVVAAAPTSAGADNPLSAFGESKRLADESPWSQFTSQCQRLGHPPRLDK
jgi:hypothetical protein